MQSQALNNPLIHWLQPVGVRLKRAVDRNPSLRLAVLGLLNGAASLLLLSPAITLVSASMAAVWLYGHIQGPLDWFAAEVLCALALVAGWVTLQQYLTQPKCPEGVALNECDSPQIFGMLERRVTHFHIPAQDDVVLTDEAKLDIHLVPKHAFPFGHKHILAIGSPLLFFLSQDLFRLALAGAAAAHAQRQRGLRGWIIRCCGDWPQLIDALQSRPSIATRLFVPLLQNLDALNETLGHELRMELQQDSSRWISEQTDEQQAEQLLASQVLADLYLRHQYWPMIMKAADRCPTPVVKPFSHFELLLEKTLNQETANRWLLQAQTCSSDNGELRDLLAGLGLERLVWSGLPEQSASTKLLGSDSLKALDNDWQTRIQPEWDEHHSRFQHDLKRLNQLKQQHAERALHGESALRYIRLAEQLLDADEIGKACQSICDSNRSDAVLNFACGRQLIASGHAEAGCEALQRAAELDRAFARRAHAIINEQNRAWLREDVVNRKARA
ncbi:diguanylate cyclase/phosphodiesterase (GGDEF & EAL domains) with PAS/PAC sensor(s) [hydrothermal vent metagenome]|uniref:Diguanylate cyclase/phosphodiesterase (GGDEF & EAL domains) with PAS/PAC sensor(S) n=1 Tax=hydrothermal vent metagenome TaxID=652676 RepID=A0A3B0YSC0_9ZZZZ